VALVAEASDLPPGRALDLGAGEGADAVWLAHRGWRVTAVDVSQVALDRGAAEAELEGVAERIQWQRHNLVETFPDGQYDLVSAQYFHAPSADFPRREILARSAAAVAPGGVLLIVGHATFPAWLENPPNLVLPLAAEVVADLALPGSEWELLRAEEFERDAPGPDGQPGTRSDNTVLLRRRVAGQV
jgi:SAM-dependent methyltransferase